MPSITSPLSGSSRAVETTSPAAASVLEEQHRNRLAEIAAASGLGCGALPAALLGPFDDAVTAALATQTGQLTSFLGGSRS